MDKKTWIHSLFKANPDRENNQNQNIISEHFLAKIQAAKENQLEELDLSSYEAPHYQKLTKIPEQIFELAHLKILNLSHNQISELPDSWEKLSNLTTLDLSGNQLAEIPDFLGNLSNLTTLDLSGNQLVEIPDLLGNLSNLTTLDLRGNQLFYLPHSFANLVNLTILYLSYNKFAYLPNSLTKLPNLKALYLSNNQIFSLPNFLDSFPSLTTLYLRDNQISTLPNSIANLDQLTTLDLRGNPLEKPPIEIVINGVEAIRKYFGQILEEVKDDIYEAKLLILGAAGVGKTTLAKKINNPNYILQSREESTKGIELTQYSFPLEEQAKELKVNIWDFGGQEIYHATHQFFLTKRSLYILVIDDHQENRDLYYWLNIIKVLSNNSPIVIIKNEKEDVPIEIKNELALRKKFTNIKEILATNLATNRGLDEIITAIKDDINDLEHIGTELPLTWIKVRQALEQDSRYYISLAEFLDVCQEQGFTSGKDKLQLSEYFHDLGICLHFQDQKESLLYQTVILKPTWVTDAVYKVLDNPQVINNQGYFTSKDLQEIWYEVKYAYMHNELLELMIKFRLCYQLPNSQNTFIAPQLLSEQKPQYSWDDSSNLMLRYKYKYFMPKGIITSFIVSMHQYIEQQKYVWKNGVVLRKNNTRAEIIEDYSQRKIIIRVAGADKRSLMTTITQKLDQINHFYQKIYTVNGCLSENK